jgi:hypothetical protein
VRIPNSRNMKPGEVSEIYQWDHDLATFVPMGRATVSEDGALLVTDAGYGVTKAGWGGNPPPPPPPPNCALAGQECGVGGCRIYSSVNGCRCLPNFAVDGKKCAECKQCLGGDCVNAFNLPCDDKKYCTENDKCVGGKCKGKDIDPEKQAATKWSADIAQWAQMGLSNGFLGPVVSQALSGVSLVIEGENEDVLACCETQQGRKIPEVKANANAQLVFPWGPYSVPGLVIPPVPFSPAYFGVMLRGENKLAGQVSYLSNQCQDKERCTQEISAGLKLEAEAFLGLLVGGRKDDNPIIDAGLFGKVGLELKYEEKDEAVLSGQYAGSTWGYRVVFFSGLVNFEKEFQVGAPEDLFERSFPPVVSPRIPGFRSCK